jgi:hypothetical protein
MTDRDPREILRALSAPFDPGDVSWRVGHTDASKTTGLALAYVNARAVEDRLDEVCGALWRATYPTVIRSMAEGKRGSVVVCSIAIKIGGEWIERCNGAGDTAVEAEKGALSDAFKRAATMWGVGRYLYGFESPWVKITQAGRSYQIAKSEHAKLAALSTKALADYHRDPKAFRPPPVEDPPERPGFKPAETPPERPPARPADPVHVAAGMVSPDVHLAALRGASSLAVAVDTVLRARRELVGEALITFDTAYADLIIAWAVSYAAQQQPEAIEALAQAIGTAGQRPTKTDTPRVKAALDKARREARAQ